MKSAKYMIPKDRFTPKTARQLKHYVYALVDPQTEEIFYVGKGSGAKRPFAHLRANGIKDETDKDKKIKELKENSLKPRVDILRHGLDNQTAHEVEAAVIDTIGLSRLTNNNSGKKSSTKGRFSAAQIEARLGGTPLDVSDIEISAILLHRKASCSESELYDATRQFWKLDQKRIKKRNANNELKYPYVFAMRGNFVLEIYKILHWFKAGSTVSSRPYTPEEGKNLWEFIGALADDGIRKKYRHKSLMKDDSPFHMAEKGIRYLN